MQKPQKKSLPPVALLFVLFLIAPFDMGGCHDSTSSSGGNNGTSGPTVTLSVEFISIGEGEGITTVMASLSEIPTQDVTVTIAYSGTATKDVDYFVQGTNAPETFVFPETSQLTSEAKIIMPGGDLATEGPETIIITITDVQGFVPDAQLGAR